MMKRAGILLLVTLAVLAWVSCTRMPAPTGGVTLRFSTGDPVTRAGDGVVADGGGIYLSDGQPDLKILLVNQAGNVVARYPGDGVFQNATATDATVRFATVPQGNYTVYAAANLGSTLAVEGVDWTTIATKADLDALLFTALSDLTAPTVGDRMPLSAVGSLSVTASSNGYVSLNLLRCVSKVEVIFKNLTGEELTLEDCNITLEDINPTTGYFFPPAEDDAAGTARDLKLTQGATLNFSRDENQKLSAGSQLVFPSVAPESPGRYNCDISFSIGGYSKHFSNLPIHDWQSRDILSLKRNQYLKIEIRISNETNISFNFEVCDWTEKTEFIEFH